MHHQGQSSIVGNLGGSKHMPWKRRGEALPTYWLEPQTIEKCSKNKSTWYKLTPTGQSTLRKKAGRGVGPFCPPCQHIRECPASTPNVMQKCPDVLTHTPHVMQECLDALPLRPASCNYVAHCRGCPASTPNIVQECRLPLRQVSSTCRKAWC